MICPICNHDDHSRPKGVWKCPNCLWSFQLEPERNLMKDRQQGQLLIEARDALRKEGDATCPTHNATTERVSNAAPKVQAPSAAPLCRLCGRGPHPDSAGHSYLPSAEGSEQQEWTVESVKQLVWESIGADLLDDVAQVIATALAAECQRHKETKRQLGMVMDCRDQLAVTKEQLLPAQAAIEKAIAVYEQIRLANAGTNDWCMNIVKPLKSIDLSLLHQHDAALKAQWEKQHEQSK